MASWVASLGYRDITSDRFFGLFGISSTVSTQLCRRETTRWIHECPQTKFKLSGILIDHYSLTPYVAIYRQLRGQTAWAKTRHGVTTRVAKYPDTGLKRSY
nr:hypothetical protein [Lactiplantibacillus plantarum]